MIALRRHYPGFTNLLNSITDHRKRNTYQVAEIIMAGLSMFIFKRASRNHADKMVRGNFEDNYATVFGLRLPIMDTVNDFLSRLQPQELEQIKRTMVQSLIKNKVLAKYRVDGRYVVAVDGTGIFSFDYEPFTGCPHKRSKSGKKTWQAHVLEAKVLCSNGWSISIATEWFNNSENISEKQDCELKAFGRLAEKIKKYYPRLPLIIVADSLYPNDTVFKKCKQYDWRFILTFKEGTLKRVWEDIGFAYPLWEKANTQSRPLKKATDGQWPYETTMFINELEYKNHLLHWLQYQKGIDGQQPTEKFVHLTDLAVTSQNVWQLSQCGRMRWKIENEGFNTQKNSGYNLQHKYSRTNLNAMQNYYQLLQIAHLINQLTEKIAKVADGIEVAQLTLIAVWEEILTSMQRDLFDAIEIETQLQQCKQLRY